jgi:hypothetical protein
LPADKLEPAQQVELDSPTLLGRTHQKAFKSSPAPACSSVDASTGDQVH